MVKKIKMRLADILIDPALMRQINMTQERYQSLVKLYGLNEARAMRFEVEV